VIYLPNLDYFILGKGPVILFLHGRGQNKEMMMPLVNRLKKHYTCVAIDMPGFGNSDYNQEINIEEYTKTIHDFLLLKLHLSPLYIIGHSFGGKVAIEYYLRYGHIKGVVLIASPVLKPKRTMLFYWNTIVYKIKKKLKIKTSMGSSDYRNAKELKSLLVSVVNTHYDKKLKNIKIPLLLIYSKEDKKVDFIKAKKLKNKVKKSTLKVIKGDHIADLNNENKVSMEINNFIKENRLKREYYL
jgi:pimeloyl-ACP methyl ester carboxylesterase